MFFQGDQSTGCRAINVDVPSYDSIYNISLNHNYFTWFDDAVLFSSYGNSDSKNIDFESNIWNDNYICLEIGNKFNNIKIVNNKFINSSETRLLLGSAAPDSIYFIGNVFDGTGLWLYGNLRKVNLHDNVFSNLASLNMLSSPVDSVTIHSNIFTKNSRVLLDLGDINNNLIFSKNVLDSLSSFEVSLQSASGAQTLKNVFITENNFIDFSSVNINFGGTSGTRSISNLQLSRNIFSISPGNNSNPLVISLSGTSGSTIVDSLLVDSNLFQRSYIYYSQSGTGGVYAGSNINIRNNIIDSAGSNPGIQIDMKKTILTGVSIINNEIANCREGISISNRTAFGYSATLQHTIITGNNIHDNDSSGILIENIPYSSNARLSDLLIANNVIERNFADGIKMTCSMDAGGTINTISDFNIAQNQIANNRGNGIHFIEYGTALSNYISPAISHIQYSRNSIVDNTLKGIWIENIDDPYNLPSPVYPFPEIIHVNSFAGLSDVSGYIQGEPLTNYKIEIFGNFNADSSGYGEGETYLDSLILSTDNTGMAVFQFNGLAPFPFYTSTATNVSTGNTSVFSNAGDSTTSIQKPSIASMEIFPNPVRNTLYIKKKNGEIVKTINVFNIIGQRQEKIFSLPINSDEFVAINFSNLQAGNYFIELVTDKSILYRKIVKE